jgi:hypothetical protein
VNACTESWLEGDNSFLQLYVVKKNEGKHFPNKAKWRGKKKLRKKNAEGIQLEIE